MRSFGALALALFAAILTECHTAQSDRQRYRSGPIRSIPVGADVKRDKDFDCPEEFGYYAHPTDCTLYYVCVFGGALLESCTGGLMYSNELQTCDWPRNVGCDATSAFAGEEIERISERDPPPPPPRRTPPPPPPRVQPNPVVTSRGQPKITREEYDQQQQLYEEIDDLPPVEEIENDRQQRVYRGQPSTIGQVQRDRDGYSQVNPGRTLNQNIIPASIPQNNGKIGSFSFGTQVDDRRQTVTVTQAPQTYSVDVIDNVTDSESDRQSDIYTNEINDDSDKIHVRRKREANQEVLVSEIKNNGTSALTISDRKDDDVEDYFDPETDIKSEDGYNTDRGKRQVRHGRYYFKNGFQSAGKNWASPKPVNNIDSLPNFSFNIPSNAQNIRHSTYNSLNSNFHEGTRKPFSEDFFHSTANPFLSYQNDGHKPFKPSLPDHTFNQKRPHNPVNSNTQIITKSPPISSLTNHDNPFAAFAAGGFFNNNPQPHNSNTKNSFRDSSQGSTTVVTGKPITQPTRSPANHRGNSEQEEDEDDDSPESDSADNASPEKDEYADKHEFSELPYEFTQPKFKFADMVNPFAAPNFDFDAFLAKLSGNKFTEIKSTTPQLQYNINDSSKPAGGISQTTSQSLSYKGMSTPRPFSVPTGGPSPWFVENSENPESTTSQPIKYEQFIQRPQQQQYQTNQQQQYQPNQQQQYQSSQQQQYQSNQPSRQQQQPQKQSVNDSRYQIKFPQQNANLEAHRPNIRLPNFKDERQIPLNFNFNQPMKQVLTSAQYKGTNDNKQFQSGMPKPYIFLTGTRSPILFSTPKQQSYSVKPGDIVSLQSHPGVTGKPYLVSSIKPNFYHLSFKPTTQKPLTTIANEQLTALQHFWGNHSKQAQFGFQSTTRPTATTEFPKLESLFSFKPQNEAVTSTTAAPPKRKIPKPSPEMPDYYYDEDEQYYYEPAVKPKYMPSSEVRPQRPPMAQNYEEYEDESYEDESSETNNENKPTQYKQESVTKNLNDVSVVTKAPYKMKHSAKIPVPVLVDYNVTPTPTVLTRPEVTNYEIIHHQQKNRTQFRKPFFYGNGPNTLRPPKFLNQTTLRPYTVRHRLAKPTTVETQTQSSQSQDNKQTRGRTRHPNIVTQTRFTTPRDSHKQETRFTTKTRHDGRTNSLEPTESVTPASYSASPKPKMLYNGSQSYAPEQYDPYYAIYDEDGELYKDTDYVQQYNIASIRPAVQQTYRGTPPPPPARRPVDSYSPRPSTPDDYDDALIRGQVNQNQYQTAIRQSTRDEGNELEFDNNPSSVRTTQYEVTSISTPPPTTTSTSTTTTTTQRPTVAPFTEAMTPRYSPRSSDENPGQNIDPEQPFSDTSVPSTEPSVFNFSSLAKPFEKTDNLHRLDDTLTPTERLSTPEQSSYLPNNKFSSESSRPISNEENKKAVSLTTGFSIRRNSNNTNNPYTLTVHTRPFDNSKKVHKPNNGHYKPIRIKTSSINVDEAEFKESSAEVKTRSNTRPVINNRSFDTSSENNVSMRRKDSSSEVITEDRNLPIYVRPTAKVKVFESRTTPTTQTTTILNKYFLKTVIKRPVPFSLNNDDQHEGSTSNVLDTDTLIEKALQNANSNSKTTTENSAKWEQYDESVEAWDKPAISPYKSLNNQRTKFESDKASALDSTTSTTTTVHTTLSPKYAFNEYENTEKATASSKPAYYSYRLLDDYVPSPPQGPFNSAAKNILRAFFHNLASSPKPLTRYVSSSPETTTENVVNIGFHKKMLKYVNEKPLQFNQKRVEIITESSARQENESYDAFRGPEYDTRAAFTTTTSKPITMVQTATSQTMVESMNSNKFRAYNRDSFDNQFSPPVTTPQPERQNSFKFHKVASEQPSTENVINVQENVSFNTVENESTRPTKTLDETLNSATERNRLNNNIYPTTTSSTRSTATARATDPTTSTKSLSFPTRASRVNPAIKLAASNAEGGRGRSYQSTKCSSDNSLQENPKCNEIKYQRPTATRGRGSAHYSTLSGNEPQQQQPQQQQTNRGTPPTRSRPTLKPSTAIVTKTQEYVDIYNNPPRRPSSVYPQPTPDKTAAKCRKDVCLLPDCSCGGKEIPGDLPVESVPQLVLLTFDDSVNDLNKGLYADLFEKGRVNPNGCPIASTFYVSHEWTDYSQVQNLYAAGHEMASHTISHSFGEQFSQKKWNREVGGQREILAAYGGVKLEDVRGMRAPFLSVGGNKMFKMLYDSNFTYDSSMPVYENRPPSWPYTLDYKLFHDCMIPPCPTKSYPGVWEVPMVMWQDLNGGRCSMGDACANPPNAEGVYKMLLKNFDRHYTTNRAPFGLFYHAAWFTQAHHKEGFIMFLDFINQMNDVWVVTNWQALQWVRDPTPISRLNNFQPFQCDYPDRPKKCNNPKVCNLWHKSGVRYMRTCQPCPEVYPWTGKTGIRSSRIDNDIEE